MRKTLNRVDSIRRGRNFIMKSEVGKMTEYMNDAKLLDNKKRMVQKSSPEVAYSPLHGDDDMKAYTRFNIIRKLNMFQKMAGVILEVQSMVTFGSQRHHSLSRKLCGASRWSPAARSRFKIIRA